MSKATKRAFVALATAFLTVAAWSFALWRVCLDWFTEGPDTPLARLLITPADWGFHLARALGAEPPVIGLLTFGLPILGLPVFYFLIITAVSSFHFARRAHMNQ